MRHSHNDEPVSAPPASNCPLVLSLMPYLAVTGKNLAADTASGRLTCSRALPRALSAGWINGYELIVRDHRKDRRLEHLPDYALGRGWCRQPLWACFVSDELHSWGYEGREYRLRSIEKLKIADHALRADRLTDEYPPVHPDARRTAKSRLAKFADPRKGDFADSREKVSPPGQEGKGGGPARLG